MRQQERKENAVSPVIGVMLMLVVTIVIAAVITGFATDLSKDSEKTPTAFFDVEAKDGKILLKHKGGDPIRLKDVQMTFEQIGGLNDNGIVYTRTGTDGHLSVRGKSSADTVVSTGDVIQVTNPVGSGVAAWTLTYVPTGGLISSGEVVVL